MHRFGILTIKSTDSSWTFLKKIDKFSFIVFFETSETIYLNDKSNLSHYMTNILKGGFNAVFSHDVTEMLMITRVLEIKIQELTNSGTEEGPS